MGGFGKRRCSTAPPQPAAARRESDISVISDTMNLPLSDVSLGCKEQISEGALRAFVAWVLPEMLWLEVCRRLRNDPITAEMHITMVLWPPNSSDCRRTLAGAGGSAGAIYGRKPLVLQLSAVSGEQANGAQGRN